MLFCDNPLLWGTGVGVELHADLHHATAVGLVGDCVAVAVDLLQGFLGSAFHFHLKDIDGIWHPHYHVHPAASTLDLGADIDIEHREYEVHGVFVELFSLTPNPSPKERGVVTFDR